jgi:hypothetical protein
MIEIVHKTPVMTFHPGKSGKRHVRPMEMID